VLIPAARSHGTADEIFGPVNYEVVEIEESGSGGYGLHKTGIADKTRPGLIRAAELLKDGSFDAMICYDVFRFSKSIDNISNHRLLQRGQACSCQRGIG
jgi:hypothetical protein